VFYVCFRACELKLVMRRTRLIQLDPQYNVIVAALECTADIDGREDVLTDHISVPLTIHNSLSLSLPAEDLRLSQIFPTIDSLPASGLTPQTSRPDRFFSASPFYVCFSFFSIIFCLVPCGRLSWLLVSCWAHVNIVYRIVSYRIVSSTGTCSGS